MDDVLVWVAESARASAKSFGKLLRTTVLVAVGWPTTYPLTDAVELSWRPIAVATVIVVAAFDGVTPKPSSARTAVTSSAGRKSRDTATPRGGWGPDGGQSAQ